MALLAANFRQSCSFRPLSWPSSWASPVVFIPPGAPPSGKEVQTELRSLERRRHLASSAITASTLSALLVCTVIAALFLEVLLQVPFRWLIGLLFTGATLALVVGLGYFLREVHMATRTVRIPAS